MAGRPKDPDTDFRVKLHVHRSYRYAATQPYEPDPESNGKMRRRYVFWGSVTEDLRFIPNERFLSSSPEERSKLIFPKEWDMSEAAGALSGTKRRRMDIRWLASGRRLCRNFRDSAIFRADREQALRGYLAPLGDCAEERSSS